MRRGPALGRMLALAAVVALAFYALAQLLTSAAGDERSEFTEVLSVTPPAENRPSE